MRRLLAAAARAGCAGLALLATAFPAAGADDAAPQVNVVVSILPERPAVNDTIRLVYTFSGKDAGGSLHVPPSLPLKGLILVGGPATSTSIRMVNLDVSRSVAVTYFLRPTAAGPAEVGEASFEIGGKVVKAAGSSLEIGAARAGSQPAAPSGDEDPMDSFFGHPRRAAGESPGLQRRGEPPILEYVATPEKTTAYVGEEIVIAWELVTQVDVDGLEPVEPPKFPGCWAEDLEHPERPQGVRGTWEGKPVLRFLLQKKVVSGLTPGTVTLPEAKVRIGVRGGGDPFGDPFGFMRRQVAERSTKPITLKILPIPGAKGDFKGPIGKFDVTARLDPPQVAAGAATSLKVRISGTGNLRTATDPPHVSVAGARLYPPTRASEPQRTKAKGTESVEWDYVLVPNAPGALTIPPIALEVFDPAARKILTKTTAALTLAVEGAAPGAAPAAASSAPGPAGAAQTEEPAIAAAPTKSATSTRPTPTAPAPAAVDLKNRTVTIPLWLLAALPGGLVVLGAAAFLVRRRARTRASLAAAIAPEPEETKERAAARMENALRTLLAAHGVAETVPAAQVPDALRAAGEPAGRVAEVQELLAEIEFLRFAPQLGDYTERIRQARKMAGKLLPKLR